jgi:hypothetical protein
MKCTTTAGGGKYIQISAFSTSPLKDIDHLSSDIRAAPANDWY